MSFDFKVQLAAGRVDAASGVIYEVTIAKAGVPAVGKFVFVDANGQIVKDPTKAVRKLPVWTDAETLRTLMGAFQDIWGRAKSRVDHNDAIEARAGWTENPRQVDDRVVGDLHLFESFAARDIVLEAAVKTPDMIGMSIDFLPTFEIRGDRAFMRISEIGAVDIVDEGAITPAGMFLNRGRVDNVPTDRNPPPPMADPIKNPPQGPEAMEAAIKTLTGRCDGLEAKHAELEASHKSLLEAHRDLLSKHAALEASHKTLAGIVAPPKKGDETTPPEAKNPSGMEASITKLTEGLAALRTDFMELKKTSAALGMKPGGQPGSGAPGTGPSADSAADPTGRQVDRPKDYLTLVADKRKENAKMSASQAHETVQRENPDAYRLHQEKLGIWPKAS